MTAVLIRTFDAENGTVGQFPPSPLATVTGPNNLIIRNSPVFSGTKSYEMSLSKDHSNTPSTWVTHRTEVRGILLAEFERIYWMGFAFMRTDWDLDRDGESWPGQIHESPSNWLNWGKGNCKQSAFSTSPFTFHNQNGTLYFNRLGGVTLWSKPHDLNIWHRIVVQFKLSKTNTGFIRSWHDGVEQPRYPTSGFAKTHRRDDEMHPDCSLNTGGTVTFVTPNLTMGCYKWNWKAGSTVVTDSVRRRGYIDAFKVAEDVAGNDDAGGYALVNPGGAPDTTAPVISNIASVSLNANSRRITWNTNESSTSIVDFGLTTSYGTSVPDNTLVTAHSIDLTNLAASTTYNYRVRSADASGNIASSANQTFTTASPADIISNVVATPGTTGVTITWTTTEARSSVIDYGTTTSYGTNDTTATLVTSHSKTITGLLPSTEYHYKLSGTNASANTIVSTDLTFTTTADISNISVIVVTTDRFRVNWTSSATVTPSVRYGLTSSYGNTFTKTGATGTSHSCNITNLTAGTTYHYQVGSLDNNIWSSDQTITLTALTEAISNIVVTSNSPTSVTITWTTNASSNSNITYGLGLSMSSTPITDETLVTNHSLTLTGLTASKTYYYKLKSTTSAGAVIESTMFNFKTRAISNGQSDSF